MSQHSYCRRLGHTGPRQSNNSIEFIQATNNTSSGVTGHTGSPYNPVGKNCVVCNKIIKNESDGKCSLLRCDCSTLFWAFHLSCVTVDGGIYKYNSCPRCTSDKTKMRIFRYDTLNYLITKHSLSPQEVYEIIKDGTTISKKDFEVFEILYQTHNKKYRNTDKIFGHNYCYFRESDKIYEILLNKYDLTDEKVIELVKEEYHRALE